MMIANSVWREYLPSDSAPWNWARAKHLHRRASPGATWSELKRSLNEGPQKSVARLLGANSRLYAVPDDFEQMSTIIADAAVSCGNPNRLKAWWLYRVLFTPDPLGEQLTLMWHNHFATSNRKVQDLALMRSQNESLRTHAFGPFRDLLSVILHDPAMLHWLDANSNRKQRPNENLARELLELFTLGVGNYSESDIKELARSLTGWTVGQGRAVLRDDRHDMGTKTLLGKQGPFGLSDAIEILSDAEPTSKRIAWRLCDHFMGESAVDHTAMDQLAKGLRDNDLNIRWGVETVLRSELFFDDSNISSQVSSPVNFIVGAVRSLELLDRPPSTLILAQWCKRIGQDLFYPPNVGGWKGGRDWLTSRSIIARSNFITALSGGDLRSPNEPPTFRSLKSQIDGDSSKWLTQLLVSPEMESEVKPSPDLGAAIVQLMSRPEAALN